MKWRWIAVIILVGFWMGSLLYQMVNGGSSLLGGLTCLLIIVLGVAFVGEGIDRGRTLGWGPEPGDLEGDDQDKVWFGEDAIRQLGIWYAEGEISLERMEVLIEGVLADPERHGIWAAHSKPSNHPTRQDESSAVLPKPAKADLPAGYFDGNISSDEPEDSTNWAEVRAGMSGKTYWVRTRR